MTLHVILAFSNFTSPSKKAETFKCLIRSTLCMESETKDEATIRKRQLALMRRGWRFGKYTFDRDELHERQN